MPLSPAMQDYVDRRIITSDLAKNVTGAACSTLEYAGVRELIIAGTLTMAQTLRLTDTANGASQNVHNQKMFRNRQIIIERILGPVHRHAHTVVAVVLSIIREEAMRYMKSLASPNIAAGFQAFTRLMLQVRKEGFDDKPPLIGETIPVIS